MTLSGPTIVPAQHMLWLPSGIFEPAPPDHKAVATTTGLALNCANSALYMAVSIGCKHAVPRPQRHYL